MNKGKNSIIIELTPFKADPPSPLGYCPACIDSIRFSRISRVAAPGENSQNITWLKRLFYEASFHRNLNWDRKNENYFTICKKVTSHPRASKLLNVIKGLFKNYYNIKYCLPPEFLKTPGFARLLASTFL